MSFFSVSALHAGYGHKSVLQDVNFSLSCGKVLGILGANGSGKTTLLRAVGGILPHGGSCVLSGQVLEELSARRLAQLCAYIPQRSGISIDISVLDATLMGCNPHLGILEYPTTQMRDNARQILAHVGLADRIEDSYMELSEGQKQLCIFARALISDTSLLLLDEPESALDFHFRHRLLRILREWITRGGRAALVTLHDPMLALNFCDELLFLQNGRVLGFASPMRDSDEQLAALLCSLYGPVSLHRCTDQMGRCRLVMLKEEL